MQPLPTVADALRYAALGWRVVPLHDLSGGVCSCGRECGNSAGKHPRLNEWQKAASADARDVRSWWRIWPTANIGIVLGSSSGIVAVDIDPPHGEDVLREVSGGDLPTTVEMITGKGRRLVYAIPEGLEVEPATQVLTGPDGTEGVRLQGGATGSQCVVPPSTHHSGRVYAWVEGRSPFEIDPAPMPDWCRVEMTRPKKEDVRVADAGSVDVHAPGADFNRRGDWWRDVLLPMDAKPAGGRGDVRYVTRPGKAGGISATINHYQARDGTPALYIFSGNFPFFRQGACYDLFGAFVRVFHGGDFSAAARDLAAKGYGAPRAPSAGSATPSGNGRPAAWAAPIPLDQGAAEPEPFPVGALPGWAGDYLASVAAAVNCPPDYVGTALLGVAGGLVGATLALEINRSANWVELPVLFACIVAPKSSGKSPALDNVLSPVGRLQAQRAHRGGEAAPLYADDVTVESLAPALKKHPRGLLLVQDELSGWVLGMNQYKPGGKGADRKFWLKAWNGRGNSVMRKNPEAPHVHVPWACVSVVGGVQPAVLGEITVGDDGLAERLLYTYPRPIPDTGYEWPQVDGGEAWAEAARRLADRGMVEGEYGPRPFYVALDPDARELFRDWTYEVAKANTTPDRDEQLDGLRTKLKGYAGRLALVAYAIRHAAGTPGHLPPLGAVDMQGGVALARYYLRHAERVFAARGADARHQAAEKILAWVRRRRVTAFVRSDVWSDLRKTVARPEDLAEPLRLLVQLNYLRYAERPAGGGRPTPRYEVNPAALAGCEMGSELPVPDGT